MSASESRVETPEYAAMLRRMIRAYGRRVAEADEVDLAEMVELRQLLDEVIADTITDMRTKHDRSWSYIAQGLGTTKQAAQQWHGRRVALRAVE